MTRKIDPTPLLKLNGKRITAELKRRKDVEPTRLFCTNRHIYVILKWIPELQIYEHVAVVGAERRAKKFLLDNFEALFKTLGKTEFDKVFQVKKVRVI